jgi:hypothetical protein
MSALAHRLSQLDLEEDLVDWFARTRFGLSEGWESCPRGDWALLLALAAGYPRVELVRAASRCVASVVGSVPRHEGRPTAALRAALRWTEGEASSVVCWAAGFAASSASSEMLDQRAADAAMAAGALAFACDNEALAPYYTQRAHVAEAAQLAARSLARPPATAHRIMALILRDMIDGHQVAAGLEIALEEAELCADHASLVPPSPARYLDLPSQYIWDVATGG